MSVKIYYGPYEAHGVIRHRTQKLHGVLNRLDELGIEAEIIPTPYINVCTVSMRSKQIFRCDIRHLMFNIECTDDPVAQRLVAAVEEAKDHFYSDGNMPKFSLGENGDKNSDEDPGSIRYLYIINDVHNEETENEEVIDENDENENDSDEASEKTFDEIIIIEEIGITPSSTEQDAEIPEQQSQSHLEVGSLTQSTEEKIISVVLPEPLVDDVSEHTENEDNPEHLENEENPEHVENPERVENEENPERVEYEENPERVENEENPERVENEENPERVENEENPEHAENEEDPEEINETHDT